jgi:tetratricopeptide (TPR) repeat protein
VANPRIDELRKRLEKEPGSRLFAQLGEELRKEGDLEGAVRICREGLPKHPNYPSARMTLGRALFDMGELAGARDEFAAVLKGAPDNILASRLLAEAHEGLGDVEAARAQFQKTLVLAPGDKIAAARLQALDERGGGAAKAQAVAASPRPSTPAAAPARQAPAIAPRAPGSASQPPAPARSMPPTKALPVGPAPAAAVVAAALARAAAAKSQPPTPGPPPPVSPPPAAAEPAPIPLVAAEESFELERPHEAAVVSFATEEAQTLALTAKELADATTSARDAGSEPVAIPLVAAEEEFELERPYEAAPVGLTGGEPAPAPGAAEEAPRPDEGRIPLVAAEEEFEIERPFEVGPSRVEDDSRGATQPLRRPAELGAELKAPAPGPAPAPAAEEVLDFDEAPTVADVRPYRLGEVSAPVEPEIEMEEPRPETIPFAAGSAPAGETIAEASAPGTEPISEELASVTLAELYFDQGFPDKAIEVYRTLLTRDAGHERARARIAEIEALAGSAPEMGAAPAAPGPIPPADARAPRRVTIERQIAGLEAMLLAIRKE